MPITVVGGLGLGVVVGCALCLLRRLYWVVYLTILGSISLTFIYVTVRSVLHCNSAIQCHKYPQQV